MLQSLSGLYQLILARESGKQTDAASGLNGHEVIAR